MEDLKYSMLEPYADVKHTVLQIKLNDRTHFPEKEMQLNGKRKEKSSYQFLLGMKDPKSLLCCSSLNQFSYTSEAQLKPTPKNII